MNKYFENQYGALIFAALGIVSIPSVFYYCNAKDFNHDISLLILPCKIALIALLMNGLWNWLGKRLSRQFDQINCYIQSILSFAGFAVLVNDFIFPQEWHVLDGAKSIVSNQSIDVIEMACQILLLMFFVIFARRLKKIFIFISLFSILYVFGLLTANFVNFYQLTKEQYTNIPRNSVPNKNNRFVETKKYPNVYLIWLDAMQTNYFLRYIQEHQAEDNFKDFTLFKNNTSNYVYTAQSNASFMSGTIYKGGDYNDWVSQDSLRRSLKKKGYNITTYAFPSTISPLDDNKISADEVFQEATKNAHPLMQDFVRSWLARSLPNFVVNHAVKISNIFISKDEASKISHIHSIEEGMYPISAVYTLKKLANDETKRNEERELVIAQAILPHGPYVIANDCSYKDQEKPDESFSEKYYAQVSCAATLTKKFLNQLKRLQRYDSSLIVIFGDHGRDEWPAMPGEKPLVRNYLTWSKETLNDRVSALLMIKPPNYMTDNHALIISSQESQLIDLYPTIAHLLGFSKELKNVDGINLYAKTASLQREKYFVYFKPSANPDLTNAKTYSISYIDGSFDIQFRSESVCT